jgi:putative ATP-binding cassette transporter
MSEQRVAFDRETLQRFVRAVKDIFTSEVRWKARGLFGLLIVFALAVNGLNVVNSYVGRDFITAISHRDEAGFVREAVLFVGVLAGTTVVAVFYRFTEEAARTVLAGVADETGHPPIPRGPQLPLPQAVFFD